MNSRHIKTLWLAAVCAILIAGVGILVRHFVQSPQDNVPGMAADQEHQVWIEACRPASIRQPLEIAGIDKNGEKGLYCAPGGGVATVNDGGDAIYRFNVPVAGRYRLWGYCSWLDKGRGGFRVTVGDTLSPVRKVATDTSWQWMPLAEVQLSAGVAHMTLTAEGDGFAVRRMFLCNNLTRHPQENFEEPVDILFDDFDGCEEGEFDSWSRVSGQWVVRRRENMKSTAAQLLSGKSTSEALLYVGSASWQNYSLALESRVIRSVPGASAAVRFYCDPGGNGFVLRWLPSDASGQVRMELFREEVAGTKMLDHFSVTWDTSTWSELSIEARDGTLCIHIDSNPVRTIHVGNLGGGGIGLWLSGEIEMVFDNVQVLGRRIRTAAATPTEPQPDNHQSRQDQDKEAGTSNENNGN